MAKEVKPLLMELIVVQVAADIFLLVKLEMHTKAGPFTVVEPEVMLEIIGITAAVVAQEAQGEI